MMVPNAMAARLGGAPAQMLNRQAMPQPAAPVPGVVPGTMALPGSAPGMMMPPQPMPEGQPFMPMPAPAPASVMSPGMPAALPGRAGAPIAPMNAMAARYA